MGHRAHFVPAGMTRVGVGGRNSKRCLATLVSPGFFGLRPQNDAEWMGVEFGMGMRVPPLTSFGRDDKGGGCRFGRDDKGLGKAVGSQVRTDGPGPAPEGTTPHKPTPGLYGPPGTLGRPGLSGFTRWRWRGGCLRHRPRQWDSCRCSKPRSSDCLRRRRRRAAGHRARDRPASRPR